MKEEQKIYIRGSKDRPSDVRQILEYYGGKAHGITDYTFSDRIYYINHDGIIDKTCEGSELYYFITKYYHEITLPSNLRCWKKGDILVDNNNINRFYVFDDFNKHGGFFVYLEISKSPINNKTSEINDDIAHLISNASCHRANDEELKTFYNILAANNLTWDTYNKELLSGNYTYFYPKNGHYYTKRNTLRCKDRATGEWYDAILYSDANGQYVRELNDFNAKFKKVAI